MKMILISCLLVLGISLMAGCGGVYDLHGVNLDGAGQIELTFINDDADFALVSLYQPHLYHYIAPQDTALVFLSKGRWNVDVLVTFWDKESGTFAGTKEQKISFTVSGLYDQVIHINRTMLLGRSLQSIVVKNLTGIGGWFYDDQGHSFHLRNGEENIYYIASGPYWLYMRPDRYFRGRMANPIRIGDPSTNNQTPVMIDNKAQWPWLVNGRLTYLGAKMIIKDVPSWWLREYQWSMTHGW